MPEPTISDAAKAAAHPYFVFDVESIGLHGEPYAVGWSVVSSSGEELDSGRIAINHEIAHGDANDREWVEANIPPIPITHMSMKGMLFDFWSTWLNWKNKGAKMFAECAWPVEAKFLAMCVGVNYPKSKWDGPYPLHDVASVMMAAGMDPMAKYDRLPQEDPKHDPLADSRQSARLLITAFRTIDKSTAQLQQRVAELEAELHNASQVSPTERAGISSHFNSMLTTAEQEELGIDGRQLHMQVLRVLSALRNSNDERDAIKAQLAKLEERFKTRTAIDNEAHEHELSLKAQIDEAEKRFEEYKSASDTQVRMIERSSAEELADLREERAWRPIEKAPKDGTWIIMLVIHHNAQFSKDPIGEGWISPVIGRWIDHNDGGWTWSGGYGEVTKWKPLPAAPGDVV